MILRKERRVTSQTKDFNPCGEIEKRKEAYLKDLETLQRKYRLYHYKNTCSSSGVQRFIPNSELLTGDRALVNCPWCVNHLEEIKEKKKQKRKKTQ